MNSGFSAKNWRARVGSAARRVADAAFARLNLRVSKAVHVGDLSLYGLSAKPSPPRYVNIGAGSFRHPFWHNLDWPNEFYADGQSGIDLVHDLTSGAPLPLADDSVHIFYCSHVIEHLGDEQVAHLFREVHRALSPGGLFRVSCPDMAVEYAAFCRRDETFWPLPTPWGTPRASLEQRFLEHFATALTEAFPEQGYPKICDSELRAIFASMARDEAFDAIVQRIPEDVQRRYPENHVNWFTAEKVERLLQRACFGRVMPSRFKQSLSPLLRTGNLFDTTCPELSLYVDATKDGGDEAARA